MCNIFSETIVEKLKIVLSMAADQIFFIINCGEFNIFGCLERPNTLKINYHSTEMLKCNKN